MCIRDRLKGVLSKDGFAVHPNGVMAKCPSKYEAQVDTKGPVSYTHLRAHETVLDLVCRLLLEKKKINDVDVTNALCYASKSYTNRRRADPHLYPRHSTTSVH